MISKELLSEVLKDNDILHFDFSEGDTILYYANDQIQQFLDTPYHKINIYELAHKCREWALSEGYIMLSYIGDDKMCYVSLGNLFGKTEVELPQPKESFWFEADTEPEAIFKACEWILSNK